MTDFFAPSVFFFKHHLWVSHCMSSQQPITTTNQPPTSHNNQSASCITGQPISLLHHRTTNQPPSWAQTLDFFAPSVFFFKHCIRVSHCTSSPQPITTTKHPPTSQDRTTCHPPINQNKICEPTTNNMDRICTLEPFVLGTHIVTFKCPVAINTVQ